MENRSLHPIDWVEIRNRVELDPEIAYLNTGTSGLVPKAVHTEALAIRARMHRNPTEVVWRAMWDQLWNSRSLLACHLQTTPDRLIFFTNISNAINTICNSISLPPGAEILMSNHEYGSMRWAWERAAKRFQWTIATFDLPITANDPAEFLQTIETSISSNTRLLFLSHILYTTGLVLPVKEICAMARNRDVLTLIDGAHAPGMLPLHLGELGADFYASNLHKWFMAEVGAAFLHVARGRESLIEPWQVSWGYHDDRSKPHEQNEFGSTPWIRQFEMEGTRDVTPWFLLHHNCDFLESIGYEAIRARHFELSEVVRQRLHGLAGLQLVTPNHPSLRGGLTAFLVPSDIDGQRLRKSLWEDHRVEVNVIDHAAGQFLRVSTHVYNTQNEIDRLAKAIEEYVP